jgi:hypothetical protein
MSWFYRVLNGLMVCVILGIIVFTLDHGSGGYHRHDLAWTLGYLIGYSLVIIAIGAVVTAIHAAVARSVEFAKWPFILFTLTYVVLMVSRTITPRLSSSDMFYIRVENRSGTLLPIVHVFGRRDEVRFDSLSAESSAVAIHHGRTIDYSDRNSYSNRVSISWSDGERWREKPIVHQYVGISDSLVVIILADDSVVVR